MKIQSAVIVLAITITLGVTFYLHFSAHAVPQVNILEAEAGPWGASAKSRPTVINLETHAINDYYSGTCEINLCVACDPKYRTKTIWAKVVKKGTNG